jgi:hypothetical protein
MKYQEGAVCPGVRARPSEIDFSAATSQLGFSGVDGSTTVAKLRHLAGEKQRRWNGTAHGAPLARGSAMTKLLASAVFLVLTSSVVAASPGVAPRVTLAGGAYLGRSDHPDGGGLVGGLQLCADLHVWWLILGGTAGIDDYPTTNAGAPVVATNVAAHLGVAAPLYRHRARDRLHEIRARAAVEIGRHNYSPDGKEDKPFLDTFGSDVTYEGASRSVRFTGERAGLSYAAIDVGGNGTGVVFALEVVHRGDRHTVDLAYDRTSCGGLFTKGCSSSPGMATAGGRELTLVASIGIIIGR